MIHCVGGEKPGESWDGPRNCPKHQELPTAKNIQKHHRGWTNPPLYGSLTDCFPMFSDRTLINWVVVTTGFDCRAACCLCANHPRILHISFYMESKRLNNLAHYHTWKLLARLMSKLEATSTFRGTDSLHWDSEILFPLSCHALQLTRVDLPIPRHPP